MIIVGKLVDGTEILGELTGETENSFQITRPVQILYKHNPAPAQPTVSFARFMPFADQHKFDIQKVDFMVLAQAVPEMAEVHKRLIRQFDPDANPLNTTSDQPKAEFYKALLQAWEHKDATEQ